MLIGFSSDTKKGYDVEVLIDFISGILDSPNVVNIGVLGMGNLGQALTKYFNGRRSKLRIVASFDVDGIKWGTRSTASRVTAWRVSKSRCRSPTSRS